MTYVKASSLLVALALGILSSAPAEARIVCDGEFQIIQGRPQSTPYCRDTYLAQVARSYGMRVTADAMRNNPTEKARVCRFIGADLRVREACFNYREEPGGRMLPF